MAIARIPADVRDRTDLSIGDLESLVALRKSRKALQDKLERLQAEVRNVREAIEKNVADEAALLASD